MKRILLALVLIECLAIGGSMSPAGGAEAASRLDTRFQLDLVRAPLTDLCWVMKKRSGVPHEVADAATGNLRASVVGKLSVAELQQALGDVLGVTWQRIETRGAMRFVAQRSPANTAEQRRAQQEALRTLGCLSPEAQSRLLTGLTVERTLATLPPRGQTAVRAMVQDSNRTSLRTWATFCGATRRWRSSATASCSYSGRGSPIPCAAARRRRTSPSVTCL
jgi:hypothetical protein